MARVGEGLTLTVPIRSVNLLCFPSQPLGPSQGTLRLLMMLGKTGSALDLLYPYPRLAHLCFEAE